MTSLGRVLIVEDDHGLRDLLARGLRAHDFQVVTAVDGASALNSLSPVPDAVVLDIGLPDSDGRDVCQAMRSRGLDVPVIFLSARQDVKDRLSGFAAGGDDYLPKPFVLAELVARLRAVLRRRVEHRTGSESDVLTLDLLAHSVRWHERHVELSPTEFRLLARLLAEPTAIVRRGQLREAGWPAGAIVADNTLDQYTTKLRRKLTELDAPFVLRGIRGVGYQIVRVEEAG
jgi:two-component system response regulator MprA